MALHPLKSLLLSLAALAATAATAAAGGPVPCHCEPPHRLHVVERLQPVTWYEVRRVYVPQHVYVARQGYVRTQFYYVDQGPSFDVPAAHYTRPVIREVGVRVAYPHTRHRHVHRKHMRGHRHGQRHAHPQGRRHGARHAHRSAHGHGQRHGRGHRSHHHGRR